MEIHFFNTPSLLKNRNKLKEFIIRQFKKEKINRPGLNIIFCTDKELLKINREYLQHDYFTDIITFDYPPDSGISSEIYISTDRVWENAIQFKSSKNTEIHRVIFHGILHIFGFSDKTPGDKTEMTRKENHLLQKYF